MNSSRCWSCGLVNFTTAENCRRCGVALQAPLPAAHSYEQPPYAPQPAPPLAQPLSNAGANSNPYYPQQAPDHFAPAPPAYGPQVSPYQPPPAYSPIASANRMGSMGQATPMQSTGMYMPPAQPQSNKSLKHLLRMIAVVIGVAIVFYIRFQNLFPSSPPKEAPE